MIILAIHNPIKEQCLNIIETLYGFYQTDNVQQNINRVFIIVKIRFFKVLSNSPWRFPFASTPSIRNSSNSSPSTCSTTLSSA